jgi:hypothetical protein
MGDVSILVYNFHVPLALKVGSALSGVGCDIALVFIFLCVGLMAIFVVLRFSPVSILWCVFCCFSVVVWRVSDAGGVLACSGVTVCRVLSRLSLNPVPI